MKKIKSVFNAMFGRVYSYNKPAKCIEDHIKNFRQGFIRDNVNRLEYGWNMRFAPKMLCPLRHTDPVSLSDHDYWRPQGKDKCCSYCGSWKPEEFLLFVGKIIDTHGKCGTIELNDHKDKIYIDRENVMNADEGAVKFRLCHLNNAEFNANKNMINQAIKISIDVFAARHRMKEKLGV